MADLPPGDQAHSNMVAICPATAQGNYASVSDFSKWLLALLLPSGTPTTTSRTRSALTCLRVLKTAKQMDQVIKERQTLRGRKKNMGLFV